MAQTFGFIFKPRRDFSKKATTIFNVPLALQAEVTVVLISFHGEQIYLTNHLRYYFTLLQKKSQHPAERFTPSPFHTVFIIGHKKKIQPPREILIPVASEVSSGCISSGDASKNCLQQSESFQVSGSTVSISTKRSPDLVKIRIP